MSTKNNQRLPDHIGPNLQVLFVGINPGLRSAEVGHHYAGHSNRFWKLLYDSRCIPIPLTYQDDWRLPEWGYGLTNIVDRPTAGIHELTTEDYSKGRKALLRKVHRYQPRLITLLGITVKQALFPVAANGPQSRVGLQDLDFGGVTVFVLPNPSGRNAHYSYQMMLTLFRQLRREIKNP